MATLTEYWNDVEDYVRDAKLIAWDTCHKIYLAMDDEQADWFRENYSDCFFTGTPDEMMTTLRDWWNESCFLRFIQAVETDHDDPNEGYTDLIPQGASDGLDDEDEWD